jgi:hypothetical protein
MILAVPLAVVEPLKLATIFIAGEGHWITGGLVMLLAYAVSLFVTEWLFVIVKPKLLTLPWFARAWAWFVAVRDETRRWVAKRVDLASRQKVAPKQTHHSLAANPSQKSASVSAQFIAGAARRIWLKVKNPKAPAVQAGGRGRLGPLIKTAQRFCTG